MADYQYDRPDKEDSRWVGEYRSSESILIKAVAWFAGRRRNLIWSWVERFVEWL